MKLGLPAIACALLVLVGSGNACAAEWHRLEADGFTFIGDVGAQRLRRIALELHEFRDLVSRFITNRPTGDVMPVRVFAVTRSTWERSLRPRDLVDGVFVPRMFGADILINAESGWDRARMVVLHEYTHYHVHNLDKFPYPLWFDEGLAQFLGAALRDGEDVVLGYMPRGKWLATDNAGWIPFERMVQIDYDAPEYGRHAAATTQFYSQSWLFMHYLLNGRPELQDGLNRFLTAPTSGDALAAATRDAFGMDPAQLDEQLLAYARAGRYRIRPYPIPARQLKEVAQPVTMNETVALREMGLAALRAAPTDPSRLAPVFSAVLRASPSDTRAMAGLAMVLDATGNTVDADRWIGAVWSAAEPDSQALRLCGEYQVEQAQRDAAALDTSRLIKAQNCFAKALKNDPDDYDALYGLAQTTPLSGQPLSVDIEAALNEASERYPQNEFLAVALAVTHAAAGRREAALEAARRAAGLSRDPEMRRSIIGLMETLNRAGQ
jgi:Flp pilus assembly protein TadD